MNVLSVIFPLAILGAALTGMVRFRLWAGVAVTVLGLLVGVLQAFRMFFLLPTGDTAPLFLPAGALVVYYGTFGLLLGVIAEFVRYLHHLTHGRHSKKDIV